MDASNHAQHRNAISKTTRPFAKKSAEAKTARICSGPDHSARSTIENYRRRGCSALGCFCQNSPNLGPYLNMRSESPWPGRGRRPCLYRAIACPPLSCVDVSIAFVSIPELNSKGCAATPCSPFLSACCDVHHNVHCGECRSNTRSQRPGGIYRA